MVFSLRPQCNYEVIKMKFDNFEVKLKITNYIAFMKAYIKRRQPYANETDKTTAKYSGKKLAFLW